MGLLIPSASEGRDLDAIFADKVPKIKDDENDKWIVGAEILAYLKYLIYSAAFKDPTVEPRGSIHAEFYRGWSRTFRLNEDLIRRKMEKQLECWYSKHPPSSSVSCPGTMTCTLEDPTESISQQHSGFTMMMKLNHRKRMLNECLAMAALEFK